MTTDDAPLSEHSVLITTMKEGKVTREILSLEEMRRLGCNVGVLTPLILCGKFLDTFGLIGVFEPLPRDQNHLFRLYAIQHKENKEYQLSISESIVVWSGVALLLRTVGEPFSHLQHTATVIDYTSEVCPDAKAPEWLVAGYTDDRTDAAGKTFDITFSLLVFTLSTEDGTLRFLGSYDAVENALMERDGEPKLKCPDDLLNKLKEINERDGVEAQIKRDHRIGHDN